MRAARLLIALVMALMLGIGAAACSGSPEEMGIPIYEPSEVVSEATGSTVLETSDSVEEVNDFYVDFVEKENWETVSQNSSSAAANLTIKKSGDGATIAISTSGSDTLISISTYASP